jgi:hypothetical protein
MSKHIKEEAKIVGEHPTRRGSDYPHPFKRTVGFRTCLICGLAKSHKIHSFKDLAIH